MVSKSKIEFMLQKSSSDSCFCEEITFFNAGLAETNLIKVGVIPYDGKLNFRWTPFFRCQYSGVNFYRP